MKTRLILGLGFLLILNSCEPFGKEYECDAIVIGTAVSDIFSCDKEIYNLKFTRGLDRVQSVVGTGVEVTDSIYAVINLPDKLKVPGMAIELDIRALEPGENPVCSNFEMPVMIIPLVAVVSADEL